MGLDSKPIADTRVYAQNSAPPDTRDGILWVDTSVSPRQTYVYSAETGSWESVKPAQTRENTPRSGGYQATAQTGTTTTTADATIAWSNTVDIADAGYDGAEMSVTSSYTATTHRYIDGIRFRESGATEWNENTSIRVDETEGTVAITWDVLYAEEMQIGVNADGSYEDNPTDMNWSVTLHETIIPPHIHPV